MASSRSRAPKALAQSTGESVIIGLFTSPELLETLTTPSAERNAEELDHLLHVFHHLPFFEKLSTKRKLDQVAGKGAAVRERGQRRAARACRAVMASGSGVSVATPGSTVAPMITRSALGAI